MKKHLHYLGAACAGFLLSPIACFASPSAAQAPAAPPRPALWNDALSGEPLSFDELLNELQPARIVYLGEYHSIPRHHELETQVLQGLANLGTKLVLAMEQFEFTAQPALDQFNSDVPRTVESALARS